MTKKELENTFSAVAERVTQLQAELYRQNLELDRLRFAYKVLEDAEKPAPEPTNKPTPEV